MFFYSRELVQKMFLFICMRGRNFEFCFHKEFCNLVRCKKCLPMEIIFSKASPTSLSLIAMESMQG